MPRTVNAGASTLRNRNRVTNKTRLKIVHGTIDADPLILDEDEEKARTVATAGLDQEDANEHHIQAVLSAASQRQANPQRSTRGGAADKAAPSASAAFIPTPDSTGLVDNYDQLYSHRPWTDPETYIRSSETVEECITGALANEFTYYMDERDKEWLDRNNEEARGEGTSAQGAASGATTRSGPSRSAKARGKEPEVALPIDISEDVYELVMGLFEKITYEKTEFLHHSLETGMPFPPFSDYQDTFATPLTPNMFATFVVPSYTPPSATLVRIAKTIYPHWKERRTERAGHRIIPTLNGDESDILNESYVCFRRREIKAIRKTRAAQVTYSDKLIRLQTDLALALELAKSVLNRETLKKEVSVQSQNVWEKRLAFVEMKRMFPTLGEKADEELLHDKERIPRRTDSRIPGLRLHSRDNELRLVSASEIALRPRELNAVFQSKVDEEMRTRKEKDLRWDDCIDQVYQSQPIPYPSRLFKFISPQDTPSTTSDSDDEFSSFQPRAVRVRHGRGGRMLVDRRTARPRPVRNGPDSSLLLRHKWASAHNSREMDEGVDHEIDSERQRHLEERWKFDSDDVPVPGHNGIDEQDRVLIDDYDSKYLVTGMTLLNEPDQLALANDPSLIVITGEGRQQSIIPFRLGVNSAVYRRDPQGRVYPAGAHPQTAAPAHLVPITTNGTPISAQTQIKKMQPPNALPQMRISSNGGMRAPPTGPMVMPNVQMPQTSPPHLPLSNSAPSVNGAPRNGVVNSQPIKAEITATMPLSNGVIHNQQMDVTPIPTENHVVINGSPTKMQQPQQLQPPTHSINVPAGYLATMNGYAAMPNGAQYVQAQQNAALNQQMQMKALYASTEMNGYHQLQPNVVRPPLPAGYTVLPNGSFPMNNGVNMNLRLPPSRQARIAANGVEVTSMNATSMSPPPQGMSPSRTPSANGHRPNMRGVPVNMQHQMQNGQFQHVMQASQITGQPPSAARLAQVTTMVSPSLQHQQPVGGSQSGY